jgi:serine/threonine protein kinase
MKKECAIIDTCVVLSDPDFVVRAAQVGFPVLTKAVFDEIDFNKKNSDASTAKNARSIFRKIKHQKPQTLDEFPCGKALHESDVLRRYEFDGAPLFVLTRTQYRAKRDEFNDTNTYNDAIIREIAKDYDLILVTEDGGNKTLAELDGIRAVVWSPKTKNKRTPTAATATTRSESSLRPFERSALVIPESNHARQPHAIPGEGDSVLLGPAGSLVKLGAKLGAGGEGQVFELTNDSRVAKIYHGDQLTENRIAKLELMASRAVSRNGICWPEKLVYTSDGSPVGYVMQKAHGHPLQKSVFVKPLLSQRFPQWQRGNLVTVCIAFLEHMQYLHDLNVLVGDINPLNVLVDGDGTSVFIVDTDSFQVEGFPCPVGTVNFSPPHLQNKNFKEILRTEDDELFAIATMLFMILVPGKPPYSQQGGESPEKNILESNFPYPLGDDHKSKNVSPGPWRYIWSHLPYRLKELFHKAFRENQRITIPEWLDALRAYQNDIAKGYLSNDVFPAGLKVPKGQGLKVTCSRQGCGKSFELFRDKFAELNEKGQSPICPDCSRVMELERLARTSAAANNSNERRTASKGGWQSAFTKRSSGSTPKPHTQSRVNPSQASGPTHSSAKKQNEASEPGAKWVVACLAVLVILGFVFGWRAVAGIIIALVVIGLTGGKVPK